MIKIITGRSIRTLLTRSARFFSSGEDKGNMVPIPAFEGPKFYPHIYGVEMKKHILPYNTYNIPWGAEQMK